MQTKEHHKRDVRAVEYYLGGLFSYSSPTKNTIQTAGAAVKGATMIRRLGRKMRRLRENAGLSQAELAQELGLSERSKGFISEIESGKKVPRAELIVKIADYFQVTTDYLLRDEQGETEDTES